ncbi:unnamed protein product [Fraxinus pennsylvanica]|uniref:EF-hand domain-containing protein n=1 Tax=Fraxinus pennsylvanica TaxID=56036 RepID=A0AAD1ZXQ6_9LAMI|nr:unnamed protein product [Fraxinus pennsylvanica]
MGHDGGTNTVVTKGGVVMVKVVVLLVDSDDNIGKMLVAMQISKDGREEILNRATTPPDLILTHNLGWLAALQLEQGMGLKSSIVILEVSFLDEKLDISRLRKLRSVLASLGLKQGRTLEDCKMMIKKVDVDGDGRVNYREFRQMMKNVWLTNSSELKSQSLIASDVFVCEKWREMDLDEVGLLGSAFRVKNSKKLKL